MRKRYLVLLILLCIGFLSGHRQLANSQPVTDRILKSVEILDQDECALITVAFQVPVRYLRHFPQSAGDELTIELELIPVGRTEQRSLDPIESIKPPPSEIAPLTEVLFEGDSSARPRVSLTFSHPVQFKVAQGSDFRSLIVAVPLPESNSPCEARTTDK